MFRRLFALAFVCSAVACSDDSSSSGGLPPDPNACGARNEACCAVAPACDAGLTCQTGTCKTPPTTCGAEGAPCCATGTACTGGLVCSLSNFCEVPPPPPPPPPAACNDPFPEAPSVSLAAAPEAILSADTDGDGDLDIVVAGGGFGLYVLRNDGTGTFTTNPKYSMQAFRIVAGDFKEDGKLDLVVSNLSNYVTFMPGPGPATTGWSSLATGTASVGLAAADVNVDGHLDLITANRDAESVSVLMGNGDGTFVPKVDYLVDATVTPRRPTAVAVGDLNGDGWPDIAAVGETMASVAVLFNSGTGTFGAPVLLAGGSSASDVTLADFNADGKLDVAAAQNFFDYVDLFLGLGSGAFAAPTLLISGGPNVAIGSGDLDGGGAPDLVTLTNESNALSVFTGQGDGTFSPATLYGTAPQPSDMALGDYDGDGDLDVAVASYWKQVVQLFMNDGAGHVGAAPIVTTATAPDVVAAAQLDADAFPELVYATRNTNTVTVLPALGGGRFGTPATFSVGTGPIDVTVGRVNADAIPDLVTANEVGTVSVLLGNGDGTYAAKTDLVASATTRLCYVGVGDFDEDLDDDILVSSYADGVTYLIESNGDGSFQAPVIATATYGDPIVADIDGDGHLDLAVSGDSGAVFVLGAGDGTFSPPVQTLSFLLEVALADVDGDGDLDYVERAVPSGLKTYLKGAGNSYTYTVTRSPPPNFDSFALLDADGDGFADLASTGDFLAVDLGKGDGTYRARATYGSGFSPRALVAADLDADGRDDLVIGSRTDKTLRVLLSVCQ